MFDPNRFYQTNDPALLALAARQTLARWRHEGRGPAFVKLGSRVAYSGAALNEWIESQTVRPTSTAAPAA